MNTDTLYHSDIHAWARHTAELLKQRRFQDIDVEHLIEELESMGRRDRQDVISRLKVLLAHLPSGSISPSTVVVPGVAPSWNNGYAFAVCCKTARA